MKWKIKMFQTINQIKYLDCKQKWQPLDYHDGAPPPGPGLLPGLLLRRGQALLCLISWDSMVISWQAKDIYGTLEWQGLIWLTIDIWFIIYIYNIHLDKSAIDCNILQLVGGFSPPLWKIWVRQLGWWHDSTEWTNKKCSKPPTRWDLMLIYMDLPSGNLT